jgi:lipoprotein-anchoring transpeptidase ErfK/SrfK
MPITLVDVPGETTMKGTTHLIFCLTALLGSAGTASALTADDIEAAMFSGEGFGEGPDPLVTKVQILLDRKGASPGVIDGYPGENVDKAIRAFELMNDLEVDGALDEEVWAALAGADEGPVFTSYTIIENDLSDLVDRVPEDYAEMAKMDNVGYTSVQEKLAERFHMGLEFLQKLNPKADFSVAGTEIMVAAPGVDAAGKVVRIEVDKQRAQVRAFDGDNELLAAFPATVGSARLPSPSGTHEIVAVAFDASYSYQPDKNFQQGNNEGPLTLPTGPNNPVGGIWIDLSKPTYGLHGTPDPELIDKTQSHGCVRMTNWDARELAAMVGKGTVVEFVGG